MEYAPDRPSLIVKLRLPSLVVKLQFNDAAAAAHAISNSNTTTPTMLTPVLDPKLFGRARSTRKRTLTSTSNPSRTTPRDPPAPAPAPAKKRKLSHVADSPPSVHASRLRHAPDTTDLTPGSTASMDASTSVRGWGAFAGPPTPPSEGSTPQPTVFLPPPASYVDSHGHVRPLWDMFWDQRYRDAMLEELEDVLRQKRISVHKRSAGRIRDLLSLATYPNDGDAKFLSKDEALAELAPGHFFNGPIFTAEQQPLALSTVPEFLGEYYDDTATVHIQD